MAIPIPVVSQQCRQDYCKASSSFGLDCKDSVTETTSGSGLTINSVIVSQKEH